jgi:hypothetical protein
MQGKIAGLGAKHEQSLAEMGGGELGVAELVFWATEYTEDTEKIRLDTDLHGCTRRVSVSLVYSANSTPKASFIIKYRLRPQVQKLALFLKLAEIGIFLDTD